MGYECTDFEVKCWLSGLGKPTRLHSATQRHAVSVPSLDATIRLEVWSGFMTPNVLSCKLP